MKDANGRYYYVSPNYKGKHPRKNYIPKEVVRMRQELKEAKARKRALKSAFRTVKNNQIEFLKHRRPLKEQKPRTEEISVIYAETIAPLANVTLEALFDKEVILVGSTREPKKERLTIQNKWNSFFDEHDGDIGGYCPGQSWSALRTYGGHRFTCNRVYHHQIKFNNVEFTYSGPNTALAFKGYDGVVKTVSARNKYSAGSFWDGDACFKSLSFGQMPKIRLRYSGVYHTCTSAQALVRLSHTEVVAHSDFNLKCEMYVTWWFEDIPGPILFQWSKLTNTSSQETKIWRDLMEERRQGAWLEPEALTEELFRRLDPLIRDRIENYSQSFTNYGTENYPWQKPGASFFQSIIQAECHFTTGDANPFAKINWHELAYKAYNGLSFIDSNGISYLKEATEMKSMFQSTAETLGRVLRQKGAKRFKALAALYLGQHYGMKLTFQDTAEYIRRIPMYAKTNQYVKKLSSTKSFLEDDFEWTARYQVYYQDRPLPDGRSIELVNRFLRYVDIWPTPENAWDMVPYSFIVDWFTDVGDILTNVGNLNDLRCNYSVLGCSKSMSATRDIILTPRSATSEWAMTGSFTEKIYARTAERYPVTPIPPAYDTEPTSPFNHSVEGAALVVQKLL